MSYNEYEEFDDIDISENSESISYVEGEDLDHSNLDISDVSEVESFDLEESIADNDDELNQMIADYLIEKDINLSETNEAIINDDDDLNQMIADFLDEEDLEESVNKNTITIEEFEEALELLSKEDLLRFREHILNQNIIVENNDDSDDSINHAYKVKKIK